MRQRKRFSSESCVLSFFVVMKERLQLPPGEEGAAWFMEARNRIPVRLHHHSELEVNLVLRGTAAYLIRDRRYTLEKGTLFWLFPGQDHLLLDLSKDFTMWVLVFSPSLVRRECGAGPIRILRRRDPPGEFGRELGAAVVGRLNALYRDIGSASRISVRRHNAGLVYALHETWDAYTAAGEQPKPTLMHASVEQAIQLIRSGEGGDGSLSELATRVGLSPARLCRVFHRQVGMSLSEFRNRQRLERYLENVTFAPERTFLAHALDAGFGSYAQFHRVFRRYMGCSPQNY